GRTAEYAWEQRATALAAAVPGNLVPAALAAAVAVAAAVVPVRTAGEQSGPALTARPARSAPVRGGAGPGTGPAGSRAGAPGLLGPRRSGGTPTLRRRRAGRGRAATRQGARGQERRGTGVPAGVSRSGGRRARQGGQGGGSARCRGG